MSSNILSLLIVLCDLIIMGEKGKEKEGETIAADAIGNPITSSRISQRLLGYYGVILSR